MPATIITENCCSCQTGAVQREATKCKATETFGMLGRGPAFTGHKVLNRIQSGSCKANGCGRYLLTFVRRLEQAGRAFSPAMRARYDTHRPVGRCKVLEHEVDLGPGEKNPSRTSRTGSAHCAVL